MACNAFASALCCYVEYRFECLFGYAARVLSMDALQRAAGNVMFRARDQNIAPPTGFALRWIVTGEGGGVATICE